MAIITNTSTVPVLYKSRDGVGYTITPSTSITLLDSEVTWNTVDSGVINGWLTVTKDDLSAMFDSYGNIADANPIPVSIGSSSVTITGPSTVSSEVEIKNDIGNPIPVSGTVTVNAGTNLNTSLLALESGGNLGSINAKIPTLGQQLAAGSMPVVLTATQFASLTQPLFDSTGANRLPSYFSSLPVVIDRTLSTQVKYTVVCDGATYIQTSTIDSNGLEIANSGWVQQ